jgi:hypothetical protein
VTITGPLPAWGVFVGVAMIILLSNLFKWF